jgi:flagellar biosynthetic protein FliP
MSEYSCKRQARTLNRAAGLAALALCCATPLASWAQGAPASLPLVIGQGSGGTSFSVPIQTLLFFTALSFLPAILLMMTGFTRIVIVLSLMRQALARSRRRPTR